MDALRGDSSRFTQATIDNNFEAEYNTANMSDPRQRYNFDAKIKILTWADVAQEDLYDVYNEPKEPSSGISIAKLERFVVPVLTVRDRSQGAKDRRRVAFFTDCAKLQDTHEPNSLCPDLEGYKMERKLVLKNGYGERNNRTSIEIEVVKCITGCHADLDI